jgi:hypothetical protein
MELAFLHTFGGYANSVDYMQKVQADGIGDTPLDVAGLGNDTPAIIRIIWKQSIPCPISAGDGLFLRCFSIMAGVSLIDQPRFFPGPGHYPGTKDSDPR